MAVKKSPSLDILVRDSEGLTIWSGPPFSNGEFRIKLGKIQCTNTKFSDDGSKLMVILSDSQIRIYDSRNLVEIRAFQVPNVLAAGISPCGTYVQTFQKPSSPPVKNVVLWKTETGESVYHAFQKNMTKATWPSIRFSSDEAVVCRMSTNEVQFFDPGDFSKGIVRRLGVPGIAAFELSRTPGSYVAVVVPESKWMPTNVQIFSCAKESQTEPVARKSFFGCSLVQLHWNHGSKGLLIVVQSDIDKANQSYYGETKLYYLTTDGTYEGIVPLRKEGPIHDVQWSFLGKEFAAVYGFMPAMVTIFDTKCKPLLELGTGPYDTVRWNPKGKFICLAGFGNGDLAFWDYIEKKKLGAARAELSVTSEWSPNGLYFMTARTAPRLQVDNGITIFHHNGTLFFKRMFDKLFQVDWKPESPDKFDDITEVLESIQFDDITEVLKSIDSLKLDCTTKQGQGPKSAQPNSGPAASSPFAPMPAAYLPPHAEAAAAVLTELFGGSPVGESSKDAMENMKNRLKQREKKAAEGGASGAELIPIETVRSNDHGESIPGLPFQEKEHYSVVVEDNNLLVKLDNQSQIILIRDFPPPALPDRTLVNAMLNLAAQGLRELPEKSNFPHSLLLFLQRNHNLTFIHPSIFDSMPELRFLDISDTKIKILPDSLFKLSKLKVLLLRNCLCLGTIPSEIGKLRSIEALDLLGTELYSLPEEIGQLTHIKSLHLSFYGPDYEDEYQYLESQLVSPSFLSGLKEIGALTVHVHPEDHRWTDIAPSIVEDISKLEMLSYLEFYFPQVRIFDEFIKTSRSWENRKVCKFNFIVGQNVVRNGYRVPKEVESLYNQEERCMRYVHCDETSPWLKSMLIHVSAFYLDHHTQVRSLSEFGITNFRALRFCIVRECPKLHAILDEIKNGGSAFPCLEHLGIYFLLELKYLWKRPSLSVAGRLKRIFKPAKVSENFKALRCLTIQSCYKLQFVFWESMLPCLANLEELVVQDCDRLEKIIKEETKKVSCDNSLPSLRKLVLRLLPELVSLGNGVHLPIEEFSFVDCDKLKLYS